MSATELQPIKCAFQRCIDQFDIAGRSCAGGVKQGTDGKTSYFRAKCANISKTANTVCPKKHVTTFSTITLTIGVRLQ